MPELASGSSLMLAPLAATLPTYGIDPGAFFAREDITLDVLTDSSIRIENGRILALWEQAPEVSGDENFGLKAALTYRLGMFHALDFLISSAPTLRDAIHRGTAHLRLLHDLAHLELYEAGANATLVQQPRRRTPVPRAQSDFFSACMVVVARRIGGADASPDFVSFRHAAPADDAPAREFFKCRIDYLAKDTAVGFPAVILNVPNRRADQALATVIQQHAALLLAQLPAEDPLIAQVRAELARAPDLNPTPEVIAQSLGLSPRSLRRHLNSLGTNFKHLLDETRQSLAVRMMRDPRLQLQQISDALGFSTASAFSRAFKRWTGQSPASFRRSGVGALSGLAPEPSQG